MKKSFYFDSFGEPKKKIKHALFVVEALDEDEVLVEMRMFPVNPSDLVPITGAYAARIKLPKFIGYEGVGIVTAVGAKVPQKYLGKRVLPLRGEGTWQTLVKTKLEYIVEVPTKISDVDAARLYINPLTATLIVNRVLRIKSGTKILLDGGFSNLNFLFLQMLTKIGCQVDAIARSIESKVNLQTYGCQNVFSLNEFKANRSDKTYDYVIDSVGGKTGQAAFNATRKEGTFLSVGLLSGEQIDSKVFSQANKPKIELFYLRHWNAKLSNQAWHFMLQEIMTAVLQKKLLLSPNYAVHSIEKLENNLELLQLHIKVLIRCHPNNS
ncbi:alcohol dehydrogenase catalytic domain-containing protein [Ligilactobacillus sp. WILCCON 0076]|uniref:Alcohol dehydrogenase catalytic domain-containing protein n=1 Tax=Ligilactobacillus ubinensis TaxID=2876789 RepID=A0A9X2JL96_9LACO|nr:zinc-binding dehydrogenase [Ligilactobacillus ubinensis]MCP0886679.1 alcohol dehydrogenase catalytic domain-containing protein [Ligilactobacillus ubinensis]